jgi:hypothetical protein
MKNSQRVNINYSSNGASFLYIAKSLLDDAGIYQITAINDHGISVYHAEIQIERNLIKHLKYY